ncbi:hypothetical protein HU200_053920 [Digitaria exilis]|uniref:Protein kinase domain-containing protein n=1 Tax=Digitaria exilis TaxID=1010633 RepID=A0A835AQL4_9POAL|nr:hypothetical protein HU200_053920 [Digitaria exilis]
MKCLVVVIAKTQQFHLLWLLLFSPALVLSRELVPVASNATTPGQRPDCPTMCGNTDIPYPFGIGDGCSQSKGFTITCSNSYNPARAFTAGAYQVINITLETGEVRIFTGVAHICFDPPASNETKWYNFTGSPFLISSEKNEFTGLGCSTVALLGGKHLEDDGSYLSGCITTCNSLDDAAGDVNCTGNGCCRTAIRDALSTVKVGWSKAAMTKGCSYAFLAEKGWYYNFSRIYHLNGTGEMSFHRQAVNKNVVPLVLNWAMSTDGDCLSANSKRDDNITNGRGYLCRCSNGYDGNPYVVGVGGCKTTLVAGLLMVLLLKEHKRRMRRGFFDKNGGEIMKSMDITTFTESELEKITNHYDTLIGRGAFGKVFRGTTHQNLRVAVKRSVIEGMKPSHSHDDGHDLVNEIAIQFQVSHENLVRLVGCCLETDVPMLVFEYVSNGNLYNVLHCDSTPRVLPLPARLDIAIGSAKALAYMHSHGGRSLVHGDIKPGNILLGDNFTPKVSDFGSSKLESIARHGRVMADMSYIDPVYMKTGCFTRESDVYSFGVVLLELITRKTARYRNNNSLPVDFVKCCKEEGNARKMYDTAIVSCDGDDAQQYHRYVECLDRIGMLAVRCLKEDKDERPSMAEVVEELTQVN